MRLSWITFSNYQKRIWDIEYQGCKIHLVFVVRDTPAWHPSNRIEVSWSTDKFKGAKFHLRRFPLHGTKWKEVFVELRKSLAYGLNPAAKAATDRLLELNKGQNKPHPIHRRSSTCGKL